MTRFPFLKSLEFIWNALLLIQLSFCFRKVSIHQQKHENALHLFESKYAFGKESDTPKSEKVSDIREFFYKKSLILSEIFLAILQLVFCSAGSPIRVLMILGERFALFQLLVNAIALIFQ